jgi:hypothetical protein
LSAALIRCCKSATRPGGNSTIDDSIPSSENFTALYCRDVSPNFRIKRGFDNTLPECREACRLRSAWLNTLAYARSGHRHRRPDVLDTSSSDARICLSCANWVAICYGYARGRLTINVRKCPRILQHFATYFTFINCLTKIIKKFMISL